MGRLHGVCDPLSPECLHRQNLARLYAKGSLRDKGRAGAVGGGYVEGLSALVPSLSPALINDGRGRVRGWAKQAPFSIGPKHPIVPKPLNFLQPLFSFLQTLFSPRLEDGDRGPETHKWYTWASHQDFFWLPW